MTLPAFFTGRSSWSSSLQFRDFRYLWASTFFQSIGMGMEQLALGWLVLEMTDSPLMVGIAAAGRMAPFFFLGILSGAIADRVDRRLFIWFTTFGVGLVSGLMALVVLIGIVEPVNTGQAWPVAMVIVFTVASGSIQAFMMTLKQAYIYDLVGSRHALNGLSLNSISQRFGGIAGALMSGILIAVLGIGVQYLVVTLTFALSVLFLLPIKDVGRAAPTQRDPVIKNLIGYVQVLRENRTLRFLMILTSLTEVFGFTHQSLLPVIARDVVGVDSVGLGYMRAVQQAGGVFGLLALARLGNFARKGLLTFLIAGGFGLGQIALSWSTNLYVFLVILACINACAMSVDTLYKTLMQANVTNEQRGRAMGSWVLSIGTAPIGHIGVGALADAFGAQKALLVNGAVLATVSLTGWRSLPCIRRLE
jgi:MFS family permease